MASCPIECDFLNEAEHTCSLFREGLSYLGPTKMRPAAIHECCFECLSQKIFLRTPLLKSALNLAHANK